MGCLRKRPELPRIARFDLAYVRAVLFRLEDHDGQVTVAREVRWFGCCAQRSLVR